jgi:NAD-dependent aldehyde dehydrogenases
LSASSRSGEAGDPQAVQGADNTLTSGVTHSGGSMNDITESLAEIGQGGLAAHAAEPHRHHEDGHTHETACLNCGTRLLGSHCHACGQAAHVHRTLGAFFHDLLHGVFHFEGRIWRTLPLLVTRPGQLTREYIDGKRASYISPIALFLFFMFLMFAVFHATEDAEEHTTEAASVSNIDEAIAATEQKIAQLEAQRNTVKTNAEERERLLEDISDKKDDLAALNQIEAGRFGAPQSGTGIAKVDSAIKKFRANPDLAAYKLQTYAYKYSWALIPISVPFLWLLFPFSRRFHLYDHTVFVTYSLCFMTLLMITAMLAGAVGAGWVGGLLFFVPPIHMYRQLRGTYTLGRFGALWRTWLLVGFSGAALALFFVMIMAQTSG